jgi:hypothetical protein
VFRPHAVSAGAPGCVCGRLYLNQFWAHGPGPILLLDEHVVASTRDLQQQFYPVVKWPGNPVIVKSEPWEGDGPYLWCNRLLQPLAGG